MVKPATSMVGAPAVGIRLQTRFVAAEKAWIFSGRPPRMAKQPFAESLISSMASHVQSLSVRQDEALGAEYRRDRAEPEVGGQGDAQRRLRVAGEALRLETGEDDGQHREILGRQIHA